MEVNFLPLGDVRIDSSDTCTDNYGYARIWVTPLGEGEIHILAYFPDAPEKGVTLRFISLPYPLPLFLIVHLLGGLALLLYGFHISGKGLVRLVGGRVKNLLWGFTSNPYAGALAGMIFTFILQSSTAATLMMVSFINGGIISFTNSIGLLVGSAVGSTLTVQIIAFNLSKYALLILAIGYGLFLFKSRVYNIGLSVMGFGFIFLAIAMLGKAFVPLKECPLFCDFFLHSSPITVFFISMIITALLHSSAVTISLSLSLAFQGLIDVNLAMPLVLGANVGTTFTALIASLKSTLGARRMAVANLLFKVLLVGAVMLVYPYFLKLVELSALSEARRIANAHLFLNLAGVIILLPFSKLWGKIITIMLPGQEGVSTKYLDGMMLQTPSVALAQTLREILRMAEIVHTMFLEAIEIFKTNDGKRRKVVVTMDDEVDEIETSLTHFLTQLSREEIGEEHSYRIVAFLYIVDELEHIGDVISKSLMVYAKKKIDQGLYFSEEGFKDIIHFHKEVNKTMEMAISAITTFDREIAHQTVARHIYIRELLNELHNKHLVRLRSGMKESLETSAIHLDLLADLERIDFHLTNIGNAVLGKVELKPL